MDEHHGPGQDRKPRHETYDANVRYVTYFAIAMVVAVVAGLLVSWGVLRYLSSHQSLGPPASPLAKGRELPPPGAPRLQAHPRQDLDQYLSQQNEILNSYGIVDRKNGIVRIPIDRAMSLLLKQGLPVRNGKTPKGHVQPGEVQQYTVPQGYMPQH
jgi:hypothetical protein